MQNIAHSFVGFVIGGGATFDRELTFFPDHLSRPATTAVALGEFTGSVGSPRTMRVQQPGNRLLPIASVVP